MFDHANGLSDVILQRTSQAWAHRPLISVPSKFLEGPFHDIATTVVTERKLNWSGVVPQVNVVRFGQICEFHNGDSRTC